VLVSSLALALPPHWHAPAWWLPQAICIHHREGAWTANTGNGYYGGFQFLLSTWRRAGGVGRPDLQPVHEQLYRAWVVYRRDGNSWREWGTARACGLK
jgi:resuscitation-promoting factor RpfA